MKWKSFILVERAPATVSSFTSSLSLSLRSLLLVETEVGGGEWDMRGGEGAPLLPMRPLAFFALPPLLLDRRMYVCNSAFLPSSYDSC